MVAKTVKIVMRVSFFIKSIIYLPIYLSVYLSIYLSIYLSLSTSISIYLSIYPSISKDLLINAFNNFAKSITHIDAKIIKTILHARKSLLFNKNEVWVKKDNPDFDLTMGSFDGEEVCELEGLYLLDILRQEFGDNKIGLYRDDGLSCFQNLSGPEYEKTGSKSMG